MCKFAFVQSIPNPNLLDEECQRSSSVGGGLHSNAPLSLFVVALVYCLFYHWLSSGQSLTS